MIISFVPPKFEWCGVLIVRGGGGKLAGAYADPYFGVFDLLFFEGCSQARNSPTNPSGQAGFYDPRMSDIWGRAALLALLTGVTALGLGRLLVVECVRIPAGGGSRCGAFVHAYDYLAIVASMGGWGCAQLLLRSKRYRADWRPALGVTAGALVSAGVIMAVAPSAAAGVMVVLGLAAPQLARRYGREPLLENHRLPWERSNE